MTLDEHVAYFDRRIAENRQFAAECHAQSDVSLRLAAKYLAQAGAMPAPWKLVTFSCVATVGLIGLGAALAKVLSTI